MTLQKADETCGHAVRGEPAARRRRAQYPRTQAANAIAIAALYLETRLVLKVQDHIGEPVCALVYRGRALAWDTDVGF
jgi:hypothetical protein